MNSHFQLFCVRCHQIPTEAYQAFCQHCGSMIDIRYDLENIKIQDSENPYHRFAGLLPVKNLQNLPSNATYTPLLHAVKLGQIMGLNQLYLKNETVLPTGTTKFRMAAVALAYLAESGVRHFCTSSTGNSSSAYAQGIQNFPQLKMSLFSSEDFQDRVHYTDSPQISHYILRDSHFVEASSCAFQFAIKAGLTAEQGFFNPGRREGLKLAFMEAVDQLGPIDWYVQAVSSAMGVYGSYKAAKELQTLGLLSRLPRLLCVQQASCSPMVDAWQAESSVIQKQHIVEKPKGIAAAILRGDPSKAYPYIYEILKESQGDCLAVNESEIRQARQWVKDLEGLEICFASATAVAGLAKASNQGKLEKNSRIVINLTGSDRKVQTLPAMFNYINKINGTWVVENCETNLREFA